MMVLNERRRRQIAKASLLANPVVEDFDVLGDCPLDIAACREATILDPFVFQRPPAALHRRVIPAIPFAAQGNLPAELAQQSLVSRGTLWAPTIAVVHKSFLWASGGKRPEACLHDRFLRHPLIHGVADPFAIEQVFDARLLKPAFVRGNVRYIGDPDTVRR